MLLHEILVLCHFFYKKQGSTLSFFSDFDQNEWFMNFDQNLNKKNLKVLLCDTQKDVGDNF